MFNILDKNYIEKLLKQLNIESISQFIYEQDCIDTLDIIQEDSMYCIHALLHIFNLNYQCNLVVDSNGKLVSSNCQCYDKSEQNLCFHNGAVLLKIIELGEINVPYHYENVIVLKRKEYFELKEEKRWQANIHNLLQESREYLSKRKESYMQNIQSEFNKGNYSIAPVVAIQDGIQLSFKVGLNKKYVIQNIPEFLRNIELHISVKYGKSLEFVHSYDAFDEDSKIQIDFMKRHRHYFDDYASNNKYFVLGSNEVDDFFETFRNLDTWYDFCEKEVVLNLSMKQRNDVYVLSYDDGKYMIGTNHLYQVDKDNFTFTRLTMDSDGKVASFVGRLAKGPLVIAKEDYPEFYKYVLSEISQYFDIKGLELIDTSVKECSLIKLFGDIDDLGQMYVYLEYYNDDHEMTRGFDSKTFIGYNQEYVETFIRNNASVIDEENHIAYFDTNSEKTLEFISNGLERLSQFCEVYVSDDIYNLGKKKSYHISVGVRLLNNLLEIDLDSPQIPKEELGDVLNAYRRRKKFHRLKNGELLSLVSDELDEVDQLLASYHYSGKDIENGALKMENYRMFSLNEDMDSFKKIEVNRSNEFAQQIDLFNSKQTSFSINQHYSEILRTYQKDGLDWLWTLRNCSFNGILADDMGLGKTLQVIALLEHAQCELPSLVICPASLIYNWEDEIHKFSNVLKPLCVCGNAQNRSNLLENYKDYDILITSYDYLRRDVDLYDNLEFDTVILDEAQNIKNQKTKNAISVKKIKANHRLALTGTPIENTLAELWSIFDFLMPNYLFNYHYFKTNFETDIVVNHNLQKEERLRKLVSPFILRRNKKEVLKELPDKIEKTQLIEFNEEENKLYYANLAQVNEELAQMKNVETSKIEILAMLTKLRQLCCEPRLLYQNINTSSSKLNACMELIREIKENGQKVLLFSSFTSMLDLIAKELYREKISYYMLTGATSKEERRELVEKFQNDDTSVFLISLKAGGTGLNLTAAEAVIHYDPWWNQSAQNQATDRAYRIGQDKNVQVFKLVMKGSIEEKIQKLQKQKKELADAFIENNEGSITKMSSNELLELFKIK